MADFRPGPAGSFPHGLTPTDDALYLLADDADGFTRLWLGSADGPWRPVDPAADSRP